MANILTLNGIEYLVDVGCGGYGLTAPLPIFDGDTIEAPINGVLPEEHRVHRVEIPSASKKGHKPWVLEYRQNPNAEWKPIYVFEKDFEFFPGDYNMYVVLVYRKLTLQYQHVYILALRFNFSQQHILHNYCIQRKVGCHCAHNFVECAAETSRERGWKCHQDF